ncbi:MAG TPA: hypothetical protein VFT22_41970 [Kofleriaceae bacterium]|nr:hypothetical protein [Kofleriaceae bacterium]
MMKQFSLLAALVVATACKGDAPAPASSAPGKDGSSTARSARIDIKPALPPALPASPPSGASEDQPARGSSDSNAAQDDARQRRNARMDSDGNGVVSNDERAAALHERATTYRQRLDVDGNGKLSYEELANAPGRRMRFDDPAALDTDHDGDISVDELAAGLKARREQRRALRERAATDPGSSGTPGAQ